MHRVKSLQMRQYVVLPPMIHRYTVITDAQGLFQFDALASGEYVIKAARSAATLSEAPAQNLILEEKEKRKDLRIVLP